MSSTGKLKVDAVFVGLTRPPMLFGVSYMMVAFNALGSMIYMINTSDLIGFFSIAVIVHVIFYIICFYEPLYLQLWAIKGSKCMKCRNRLYHGGTNSYELF